MSDQDLTHSTLVNQSVSSQQKSPFLTVWTWLRLKWAWLRLKWQTVLGIAVTISLISLLYQAGSFALSNKYQVRTSGNVQDVSRDPPIDLQLDIAYPVRVRFEEQGHPGRPVSVWLWVTKPVSASVAVPMTYTVRFESSDKGLLFTDKDGVPTAPQTEIVPCNDPGAPSPIYLHPEPAVVGLPKSVTLTVSVDGPSPAGVSLKKPLHLIVGVEKQWFAAVRRFASLLLGPTTFLLGLAGTLLSVGLRRWEEERREAQARLSKIQTLRTLAREDLCEAVRLCCAYDQNIRENVPGWKRPELEAELEDVQKRIFALPWQLAMLKKAVGHLNSNEPATAKKTAELIMHILSPDSRSREALVVRLLVAHVDGEQKALEVALDDPRGATEALFWLHREFHGAVSHRIVIPILAELAGRPEAVGYIEEILAQTTDGERLLREQEFREPLERLSRDQNIPPETRDIAKNLLEIRGERHDWPPLWLTSRPAEDENVEDWLEQAKLKDNPFGPEWAELEQYLFDFGTYPSVLEPSYGPLRGKRGPLRGERPAILFGASGSGKTATALLLAHDCTSPPPPHGPREKSGAFPVYCKLPLGVSAGLTRAAHLNFIARAVGETLIRFLARNPYAFLDHERSHETAIASLLIHSAGSLENLIICLERAGLSGESAGQRLLAELKRIGDGEKGTLAHDTNQQTWLEVLRSARPVGFNHTYVLADVVAGLTDQHQVANTARQLQPLADLIIPMASAGVYLKLFLPEALRPHLHLPADVIVETIQWTSNELKSLLETRLNKANRNFVSLDQLLAPPIEEPGRADSLIVEAAQGSPRRLIRLGNQLIKRHVNQNPGAAQIGSEVLDAVIESTEAK